MILNWLIPVVIAAVGLPLVLTSGFLAAASEERVDWSLAADHGELFLGAGNAIVASSALLVASRHDQIVTAMIGAMCALLLLAVPSYAFWSYFAAQAIEGNSYDLDVSNDAGLIALAVALIVSFAFSLKASQYPAE